MFNSSNVFKSHNHINIFKLSVARHVVAGLILKGYFTQDFEDFEAQKSSSIHYKKKKLQRVNRDLLK